MRPGPYTAVCGLCNVPLRLHPVESCKYEYKPVIHNGVTYGYRMIEKKKKNGKTEEAQVPD